jgi:hypothetical protein
MISNTGVLLFRLGVGNINKGAAELQFLFLGKDIEKTKCSARSPG